MRHPSNLLRYADNKRSNGSRTVKNDIEFVRASFKSEKLGRGNLLLANSNGDERVR